VVLKITSNSHSISWKYNLGFQKEVKGECSLFKDIPNKCRSMCRSGQDEGPLC
jgi:hypothetical protein